MLQRSREDVAIGVPSRTYDVTFPRVRRFLFLTRVSLLRRRYVVAGLPLRELLVMHSKIQRLSAVMEHLTYAEACVVILGTTDALRLTDELAKTIWDWWHEANCLAPSTRPAASGESSSVLDLVFQLERWPFNFPTERVMRMTSAEAVARLEEFASASEAARAAAVT